MAPSQADERHLLRMLPDHNVPAALNSFVGRDEERVEVARLLDTSRLVTLVGTPGVGKTRLALEVAADVAFRHFDGAWVVELASVADPDLLPQTVASVLGVRERPGIDLLDTLVAELCHRRMLLLLDNCEHLVEGCAQLVEQLLRMCSGLTVLATSREPLGVPGEWVRRVDPLDLPATAEDYHALVEHDAVRLFVERGASTQAGFRLTPELAPTVAEICRRLDGLPLAIELAAARLEVLSPQEMLKQLDQRFRVLRKPTGTAPVSHRSLLAALDWSHNLLTEAEATVLRRLSVFSGGCTLEGAEAVCADSAFGHAAGSASGPAGGDGIAPDAVIDLLGTLIRKSLVFADTGRAETRFRLLDTVRDYAARKLEESGEETDVRARHCAWTLALAERAEPELPAGTPAGWLERLEAEQDNFRAAFEWAIAAGRTDAPLRLGGALHLFWWLQGHVREGRHLLDRALAAGRDEPPALRAKALLGAAFLLGSAGSVGDAMALAEESLALAGHTDDASVRDRARNLVGLFSMYRSPLEAIPGLERNVNLNRERGDAQLLASSLSTLAHALLLVSDTPGARARLDECLQIARDAGNRSLSAQVLGGLGQAAVAEGRYPAAEAFLGEALAIAREIGERGEEAVVLSWLGELERARGNHDRARAVLHDALTLARDVGRRFLVVRCQCFLGRVALDEGRVDHARSLLTDSLDAARTLGLSYLSARCLLGLGQIAWMEGDATRARASVNEALTVAEANGDRQAVAACWFVLADGERRHGPLESARALAHQALALQDEIGDRAGLASSIELLAALRSPGSDAVRLFGAAHALRAEGGYARPPLVTAPYEADLAAAREGMSADEYAVAWAEGLSLPIAEAVAYASRGRGVRRRPTTGWASLTPAEYDVARLAGEGLTNREIGERLFVSPRTAGAHLAHVFAKLGISSRRELARMAPGDAVPPRPR